MIEDHHVEKMAIATAWGRTHRTALLALAICALPGAYGLDFIHQERAVLAAQDRIERNHVLGAEEGERDFSRPYSAGRPGDPPRLLLAAALIHAQQAAAAPLAPQRAALLQQARQEIDAIAASRPYWGEADVVRAYIASLSPTGRREALAALARSYESSPYLLSAAAWRWRFGIEHWGELSPAIQARLIDEAVWLARLKPDQHPQVMDLARGTDAYKPLLLRWREMRLRDQNLYRRP